MLRSAIGGASVMNALSKGPNGKFIGIGSALFAWLPIMLEQSYRSNPLQELLDVAARWCEKKAAESYRKAANSMEFNEYRETAERERVFFLAEAEAWIMKSRALKAARETVK